jgi:hypothetical protein
MIANVYTLECDDLVASSHGVGRIIEITEDGIVEVFWLDSMVLARHSPDELSPHYEEVEIAW